MSRILSGFFETDLAAIAQANASLLDPTAPAADRSSGEVRSASRWWQDHPPNPRGLWSPDLFAEDRYAHVAVNALHPATIDAVAECLKVSAESLRRFETWDTNHEDLFVDRVALELERAGAPAALRAAAIVRAVPVPPPSVRPFVDPAPPAVDRWCGPRNEAWLALVWRAARCRRLAEIGSVPFVIVNSELRAATAALAVVFEAMRTGALPKPERVTFSLPVSPVPTAWPASMPSGVLGLLWLGDERLYVQRGVVDQIVRLDGAIESEIPACGRRVESRDGDHLAFGAWLDFGSSDLLRALSELFPMRDDAPVGAGMPLGAPVARLELPSRTWLREGDAVVAEPWLYGDDPSFRELDDDSLEYDDDPSDEDDDEDDDDGDGDDDDASDDDELEEPDAAPTRRDPPPPVWTADGRYVWWPEGLVTLDRHRELIVEAETAMPQWRVAIPPADVLKVRLESTGDPDAPESAIPPRAKRPRGARAIALVDGRWLLLHEDGRVTHDTKTLVAVEGAPITAAAFSSDGRRLALGYAGRLAVLDLASFEVRAVELPALPPRVS